MTLLYNFSFFLSIKNIIIYGIFNIYTIIINILYLLYDFFILRFLPLLVPLLIAIAYFTLIERQVMAVVHRRQGPHIVGFYGLLQPIVDGVKLLLKETILPKSANLIIFIFAPIFTFGLALASWAVIPLGEGAFIAHTNISILYIFAISSLSVHSVIMAGWSSNSKYAFLGALRSAAQMISYEVSLGVTILSVIFLAGSLDLSEIIESQKNTWFILPLFPVFLIFFICTLAETNRHPFDLPEAEAELVSGYNVEYSAMGFALFFLAEYSNIILMCCLTTIFFLGGWFPIINIFPFNIIPDTIWFGIKTLFSIIAFIVIRATLPRFRYDQLMRLGWKVFLPISLCFIIIITSIFISINIIAF